MGAECRGNAGVAQATFSILRTQNCQAPTTRTEIKNQNAKGATRLAFGPLAFEMCPPRGRLLLRNDRLDVQFLELLRRDRRRALGHEVLRLLRLGERNDVTDARGAA